MCDQYHKVFVGNVPFDCNDTEFDNYLKSANIDGYVKGEIVSKHSSEQSRGFGFITIEGDDNAKKIIERNDINFKNRQLRFTNYVVSEKQQKVHQGINGKNYILVSEIPDGFDRDSLRKCFEKYSQLGKYFICSDRNTGESKKCGIVEILDINTYNNLILMGQIATDSGEILKVAKYKNYVEVKKERKNINFESNIFNAYNAGRKIGILEGIRLAQQKNE